MSPSAVPDPAAGGRRRFLAALTAVGLLLWGLDAGGRHTERLLAPADTVTAGVTAALLRVAGTDVERDGVTLRHPNGFTAQIYYKCSEWLLALVLGMGLLGLPGGGREKLLYLLAGAAALAALNQVRLITLFWAGARQPSAFHPLHKYVWEPVILSSVGFLWLLWMRRHRKEVSP